MTGNGSLLLVVAVGSSLALVGATLCYVRGESEAEAAVPDARPPRFGSRAPGRFDRSPIGRRLAGRLHAAGVEVAPLRVVGTASAALLALCAIALGAFDLAPHVVGVLVVGAAYVATKVLDARAAKREAAFRSQLPELSRTFARLMGVPRTLEDVLDLAAERVAEPAAGELRMTASLLRFGWSDRDAIRALETRMPSEEIALLTTTLIVAGRAGGDLPSALNGIAIALDDRRRLKRAVQTHVTGPIATGRLVAAIGLFMVLVLQGLLNPDERLTSSPAGVAALTLAGGLSGVGLLAIRRLLRTLPR